MLQVSIPLKFPRQKNGGAGSRSFQYLSNFC
jgi:hypothetical protein